MLRGEHTAAGGYASRRNGLRRCPNVRRIPRHQDTGPEDNIGHWTCSTNFRPQWHAASPGTKSSTTLILWRTLTTLPRRENTQKQTSSSPRKYVTDWPRQSKTLATCRGALWYTKGETVHVALPNDMNKRNVIVNRIIADLTALELVYGTASSGGEMES